MDGEKNHDAGLLDGRAACKYLSVSPRQLARFVERGELPAVKLGRKCVRYRVEDIHQFIQARVSTVQPGRAA